MLHDDPFVRVVVAVARRSLRCRNVCHPAYTFPTCQQKVVSTSRTHVFRRRVPSSAIFATSQHEQDARSDAAGMGAWVSRPRRQSIAQLTPRFKGNEVTFESFPDSLFRPSARGPELTKRNCASFAINSS